MSGAVTPGTPNDGWQRWYRWSAGVCVLVAVILWMGPYLIRMDVFNDDANQHLFWMYRFADPQLFPNDLTVRYFGSSSSAPWGYQGLYFLLARWLDLQVAAEWVAVLLVCTSAWLAWRVGVACGGRHARLRGLAAVTAVLAMLSMGLTDIMSPLGLQRSFALSLMLLPLWALITRRYRWVGVSWVLSALVYPVTLVVTGLTAGFVWLSDLRRERRLPPGLLFNVVAGAVAIGIVLPTLAMPAGIGPTLTGDQARAMPEFYEGGRLPTFGGSLNGTWLNDHHIALGWSFYSLLLLAAAVAVAVLGRRRAIPFAGWVMVGVGVGVWLLSRQMLFLLYLPNRHSRWSIACFAMLAYSVAAVNVFEWLERRAANRGGRARSLLALAPVLVAPLVVAAYLAPESLRMYRQPVDVDMERAYQFLAGLPKATLVAAHPDVADEVPMRSRRSVLASTETALPWGVGYYRQLTPRIQASLRAAYATSVTEMDADLAAFGVDVFLTNRTVWQKPDYFKPFDRLVHDLRSRGDRLGFALRSPPPERVLFRSGDVYVLRVQRPQSP